MITLAATVVLLAGCGAVDDGSPGEPLPSTGPAPVVTGTVTVGGRTPIDGFGEVTATVVDAAGQTRTLCLLLADTAPLQQRGLMYVTDPKLGGYDGMVFSYEQDDDGGFWMRNTRLPLSIAWIRADGSLVSAKDMVPCPDSEAACPVYPSGGAYRLAIEVPQGRLDDVGISEGSRVSLGAKGCAPSG
jgi:uncharacterized membrane protein (UPF0127 family)